MEDHKKCSKVSVDEIECFKKEEVSHRGDEDARQRIRFTRISSRFSKRIV